MSDSSPSSAGNGPQSSPFAGTDATQYSPEMVRKGGHAQSSAMVPRSSIADGKKPVKEIVPKIHGIEYDGMSPLPHRLGTFVNELAKGGKDFISRFLYVGRLPDGTIAGQDPEMEQYHVQHQMKLVSTILLHR
jgi:hypothetical protein